MMGPAVAQRSLLLEQALQNGQFAITAEVMPPRGGDAGRMLAVARTLKGLVHAINVTATLHFNGDDLVFVITTQNINWSDRSEIFPAMQSPTLAKRFKMLSE